MKHSHTLHDCREMGGSVDVTLLWIHPIHQNLCRIQWPRVGNNIEMKSLSTVT